MGTLVARGEKHEARCHASKHLRIDADVPKSLLYTILWNRNAHRTELQTTSTNIPAVKAEVGSGIAGTEVSTGSLNLQKHASDSSIVQRVMTGRIATSGAQRLAGNRSSVESVAWMAVLTCTTWLILYKYTRDTPDALTVRAGAA